MTTITYLALAFAVFSLLVGFVLLWVSMRGDGSSFGKLNPMSWMIVGLFPVFMILVFFPAGSVSITILGASLTGAGALFILIWKYGVKWTKEAYESTLAAQLGACQKELALLQNQPKAEAGGRKPIPYQDTHTYLYSLANAKGKRIGLVTGNIDKVKFADIWVSSENTNMEMARYFDTSVSASVRYHGAKKNIAREVIQDLVGDDLEALLKSAGLRVPGHVTNVPPGTVLATIPGELSSRNVKKIFHVAAVRGDLDGGGYLQVPKVEACVANALDKVDDFKEENYKSILFPLFGTGRGGGDLKETARKLIVAAVSYFENNQGHSIDTAYFLAWSDIDLEACQGALNELGNRVIPPKP